MGELTCSIHLDRTAVAKCGSCKKYICLECKKRSIRSSDDHDYYICPYCLANELDVEESETNAMVGIVCCVFLVFFVIIGFVVFQEFEGSFSFPSSSGFVGSWETALAIILAVVIVALVVIVVISAAVKEKKQKIKQTNARAEAIRAKAKKETEESKKYLEKMEGLYSEREKSPNIALYCRWCGAPLTENDTSCDYCGMQWKWIDK